VAGELDHLLRAGGADPDHERHAPGDDPDHLLGEALALIAGEV
jgi:hypothetical protein